MGPISITAQYTALGALFGLAFPLGALALSAALAAGPVPTSPIELLRWAHAEQPLLWIIDTAPVFLGLFAAAAGRRQQALRDFALGLEHEVQRKTESLQAALVESRRANEQITHMARHDSLTGLANRHCLQRELGERIAQAGAAGEALALAFIDLNDFKAINDQHGHDAGDLTLQAVAAALERVCGGDDLPARWGGDEFVVLLARSNREAARGFATRLRKELAQTTVALKDATVVPRASIGIAAWPEDGPDAASLMDAADAAMYVAKRQEGGMARRSTDKVAPNTAAYRTAS